MVVFTKPPRIRLLATAHCSSVSFCFPTKFKPRSNPAALEVHPVRDSHSVTSPLTDSSHRDLRVLKPRRCVPLGFHGKGLLWMDEILHHLRNPAMMIPCKYQQTMPSYGFKVVQDFVHPQYQPQFRFLPQTPKKRPRSDRAFEALPHHRTVLREARGAARLGRGLDMAGSASRFWSRLGSLKMVEGRVSHMPKSKGAFLLEVTLLWVEDGIPIWGGCPFRRPNCCLLREEPF